MTEVAEALKAMLQKAPLPSQEIHKWAAANRIPRTLLFEGKAKANVRAKHDGKEQQWSWEIPCLYDFP